MSYLVWLARMGIFGLIGLGPLLFFFRAAPSQQNNVASSAQSAQVVAIDPELNWTPPTNDLSNTPSPALPATNLESLLFPPESQVNPEPQTTPTPKTTPQTTPTVKTSQETPSKTTPKKTSTPKAATTPPPTQPKKTPQKTKAPARTTAPKNQTPTPPPFNLAQSLTRNSRLFASPIALGMLAIGSAEGNYRLFVEKNTLYVERTANYFGHTDPGNLSWGERVTNYGPCSDQGRSGGNIALAEKLCLDRSLSQLETQIRDLVAVGLNPDFELEALLNTADLYNQASPIHSRLFPRALAMARQGGKQGLDAIVWARTASFYLNENKELDITGGRNTATGLIGICARERRPVTEWECVYADQLRRARAIASVLELYLQVYRER